MTVLDRLFGDRCKAFLQGYPHEPCVAHGTIDRLGPAVQGLTLAELAPVYRGPVYVHTHESRPIPFELCDESGLMWLLSRCAGLTIHRVERVVERLQSWCADVAEVLSIPPNAQRPHCNAFASPGPSHAQASPVDAYPFHFHADGAFLVQLEGRKEVLLAHMQEGVPVVQSDANRSFESAFASEPRALAEYAQFARDGFPAPPDPTQAERVLLEPGSVLFIPAGTWHATKCLEPSFAFTTFVRPIRWMDAALRALELRMLTDPAWRAPVGGGSVSEDALAECRQRLTDGAAGLRNADLSMCLGHPTQFTLASTLCPNPDARWRIAGEPSEAVLAITTHAAFEVELEPELADVVRALLVPTRPYVLGAVVPSLTEDVVQAVTLLTELGALVRGPFPLPVEQP